MTPRNATGTRRTVNHDPLLTDPEWAPDRAAHRREVAKAPELRINQAVKRGPFLPGQLERHAAKRGVVLMVTGAAATLITATERYCVVHVHGRTDPQYAHPEQIAVLCGTPPITQQGAGK